MDKFLQIADNQNFGRAGYENFDFGEVDEQTFHQYMQKLPIWDLLKVSKERYLSSTREGKLIAIKNYIQAMRNASNTTGSSLTGEFI